MDENLDLFTKGEFSTTALVDSATSSYFSLSGIFDERYENLFDGYAEGQSSGGRKYCLRVQTAEADELRVGDRLRIQDRNYQIVSLEPKFDGSLTYLILKQDFK